MCVCGEKRDLVGIRCCLVLGVKLLMQALQYFLCQGDRFSATYQLLAPLKTKLTCTPLLSSYLMCVIVRFFAGSVLFAFISKLQWA